MTYLPNGFLILFTLGKYKTNVMLPSFFYIQNGEILETVIEMFQFHYIIDLLKVSRINLVSFILTCTPQVIFQRRAPQKAGLKCRPSPLL